jgi:hypothetical protein
MLNTLNDSKNDDTVNNELLLLNKDQNHNNLIDSNDTSKSVIFVFLKKLT